MKLLRAALIALICAVSSIATAADYRALIDEVAAEHDVDPVLLRAVATVQSKGNPWAVNIDGESFHFASRDEALHSLKRINASPWMVKHADAKGQVNRNLFGTEREATTYLQQLADGTPSLKVRTDSARSVKRGEIRMRKLWTLNTSIGMTQVNYRFHARPEQTVQQWLEPRFNLAYTAALIADKRIIEGSDFAAAVAIHSTSKAARAHYTSQLARAYQTEAKRK